MKIIFDNEEEMETFFCEATGGCPCSYGDIDCKKYSLCSECWKANVPYEITNQTSEEVVCSKTLQKEIESLNANMSSVINSITKIHNKVESMYWRR